MPLIADSRSATAAQAATLAGFRDVHRGGTILVCGCGESLNLLVRPERFVTIGVNDVGRRFTPDYLVVVNPRSQFTGDRFRHVESSRAKALFTQLADLGVPHPNVVRFRLGTQGGADFSDPDVLHYTSNSPYVAVCLAVHMGARRIGLLGVDFTEHHFFARTGAHSLARRLPQIEGEYARLAESCRALGIDLVNLSPTSRLTSVRRGCLAEFDAAHATAPEPACGRAPLRIVSYATTPVAGVPVALSRCIEARTPNLASCVWERNDYGNGVRFDAGVEWNRDGAEAERLIREADAVVVHNGKVAARHARLLEGKPVVTLAHNYMWNVDPAFVKRGLPGLVVGQYQATLPEFAGWTPVPNPIPLWEPVYRPEPKPPVVTVCYTPSGRHERYPPGHRLHWHGKGYDTTLRVLDALAARFRIAVETVRGGQVPHERSLAMKRRSHIVIDECVTGSYHRNSLEGLAAGCVVVNGVGLLPGVVEVLRRCAGESAVVPFEHADLDIFEDVLSRLISLGPEALAARGRENRDWLERHWDFAGQWERFWAPAVDAARAAGSVALAPKSASRRVDVHPKPQEAVMQRSAADAVSVVVPHGGAERLALLATTLATLRQRSGIREVIVAELGERPLAAEAARRWADKHLFIEHHGPFERARALNAGSAVAEGDFVLWHDNDVLVPPDFVALSLKELCDRRLDYLVPYTSVRYLSEPDSQAVMRGERSPEDCRPVNTFHSGRAPACFGGIGLARRDFLIRHGGLVEGFRGWGGEDNAWNRKVQLLGSASTTTRPDQHVHHLHHHASGGYQMGAAMSGNPHYSENLALLRRVLSVRNATQFREEFPSAPPSPGTLSRSNGAARPTAGHGLPIWTYWEGPCPAWIRACRRTIATYAPRVRLLTPETFDRLRDRDRDIDLSRLHAPHRADYVRAFLLQRYGGLWIDADCLVMQPLQPLIDLLAGHEFIGHRERVGLISNAFIAASPGSRIASEFYERVCRTLRGRKPLEWNAIGAAPLSAIVSEDPRGWHELPCERVQPVCWSRPGDFFADRDAADHDRVFDPLALCYMLSNGAINNYASAHGNPDLLGERTFFTYLLRRSLGANGQEPSGALEEIFATHVELYRRDGNESISGPGSCVAQTREIRERLPRLLESLGVRSLLDAPCGDLNWMQHVRLGGIEYVGIDVLGEIVAQNRWRHEGGDRRFERADVVRDALPRADAVLCRDLLVHLSFADVRRAVANFKASGATYLITTTFAGPRPNQDIPAGGWRTLNFTLPPFNWPAPLRVLDEKCTEGGGAFSDKSLGVWRLAELDV